MNRQNRLMISATGSGCGKTTITCAILYGLKQRFASVAALKCGPDYIDPLFHRRVLGLETGNLDAFLTDSNTLKDNLTYFCDKNEITIIEGAMGYFDGIGMTDEASAYNIACLTKTPVILILDARGMGRSILAVLDGFLANDAEKNIKGVIVNNTTESLWNMIKSEINKRGIAPIGWVCRLKSQSFDSRHLGLVTPDEISDFNKIIHDIFKEIENNIDWEKLLELSSNAPLIEYSDACSLGRISDFKNNYLKKKDLYIHQDSVLQNDNLTIAIARDEAFCFYYSENIRILEDYGCRIKYFSPLRDKQIPEGADGLILWGGYPECFADGLEMNRAIRRNIYDRISAGLPTIAECGGFLYLQKTLEGRDMVGIYDQHASLEDRLRHFGYIEMRLNKGASLFNKKEVKLKAHEFHYCHMADEGNDFDISKASGTSAWKGAIARDNIYAGFPHIFFPGNIDFLESFLEKCIETRTNVRKVLQFTR